MVVLSSFLTLEEQQDLVQEVLQAHRLSSTESLSSSFQESSTSSQSIKLNLGIACGGDLSFVTPTAVGISRRVFRGAFARPDDGWGSMGPPRPQALQILSCPGTPLTGTALLYGPNASMPAHYDSPTQPLQREEWLCILSVGLTAVFRCNNDRVELRSGDVLVMDSMAVLHGVEEILQPKECDDDDIWERVGLPWPSRLGIIMWHGKLASSASDAVAVDIMAFEGMATMFDGDGDSELE